MSILKQEYSKVRASQTRKVKKTKKSEDKDKQELDEKCNHSDKEVQVVTLLYGLESNMNSLS